MAVAEHDVAGLEITVQKVFASGAQQEFRQPVEIVFQSLFVEGDAGEPEKVVLEVVQIPSDGLAIEAAARIALLIIQIAACLDLETRKEFHYSAIRLNYRRGNARAVAILGQKLKKSCVSQVFLEVGALA